jgi:hypothetical protein
MVCSLPEGRSWCKAAGKRRLFTCTFLGNHRERVSRQRQSQTPTEWCHCRSKRMRAQKLTRGRSATGSLSSASKHWQLPQGPSALPCIPASPGMVQRLTRGAACRRPRGAVQYPCGATATGLQDFCPRQAAELKVTGTEAQWPLASPELERRHAASGQWPSGFAAPAMRARRPGQPGVPARILVPCARLPVALKVPVVPLLPVKAGAGTVQRASDGITAAPPERQPERQPEHRGTQLGSSNHPAPWAPTGAKAQTRPLASALSRQVLTIIRAISVRTPQAPGLSVVTAFATLQSRERPAVPGRPLAHKAQHCDKCAHNGVIHKMLAPSRRPRCGHTLKCWAWSLNRARRMGNSGQSTSRTTSRRC